MSAPSRKFHLRLCLPLCALCASAQSTVQVSVSSAGVGGNGFSLNPALSADGRCVVFSSTASNLVASDPDATEDVYVRDLVAGTTELASQDSNGVHGNGASLANGISADGRFVLFESLASNLVPGDINGRSDIFVRDRLLGTTELVSVSSAGAIGNGNSVTSALSPDGRYASFRSRANNLVPNDTNNEWDVFLRDLANGTTERVNLGPANAQAHGDSYTTSVSEGGRFVIFSSLATDLVPGDLNGQRDVFVRDRLLAATILISVSSTGIPSNGDSHAGYLSADGRFGTFVSSATTLVPNDTNGVQDVFVHEFATHTTTRASVRPDGVEADAWSTGCGISPDGRFVAITSDANNLVPGDLGVRDLFVRDSWTGSMERVTLGAGGVPADQDCWCWGGAISADARRVVFFSTASNLVPSNPGGQFDVYLRERGASSSFLALCAGDAGCPCGNPGLAGRGCENSAGTGGALLAAAGEASLSADTLQFSVAGELPSALSIALQGDALVAPAAFGDGLRCAGGHLKRLYVANASGGALALPPVGGQGLSARSAALGDPLGLGATRVYQVYYRDPNLGFCAAPAGGSFNVSGALAVVWGS
ncbi:MAG: hypothetical protein IPJ19_20215 [Planctomycetes bacterium]|nr:hypothetical protein [Planctomycetota bacterium]